jgi:hypothetical protein
MNNTVPTASDLADQPMLIVHGIWMTRYAGPESKIYAKGFKVPAALGWGGEMFNFEEKRGRHYGFFEVMEREIAGERVQPQLHIEKLGASESADRISDVLVVWTAPDPRRPGRTVVGWYKNATVYRHNREPGARLRTERTYSDEVVPYRIEAAAADCVLLAPDDRSYTIPPRKQGQKGVPGQFTAYYPATRGEQGAAIEQQIREFISTTAMRQSALPRGRNRGGRQPNAEDRKRIEQAAVDFVWDHFEKLNYTIKDRQSDNKGYDLKAVRSDETLCIEVKGRFRQEISAEFTPNEYRAIQLAERGKFLDGSYRICVVTDALGTPRLNHFLYWPASDGGKPGWWSLDAALQLDFEPVVGARVQAIEENR